MNPRPVLRRGATGPTVAVLHARLTALGLPPAFGDAREHFGAATEEALRSFQRSRALQVDGICGPDSWAALDEAGWALGDRLLSLRHRPLRGDDVADLQHRLDRLGFDVGRIDGIFGRATEAAVRELQRAAGIAPDGVCGPETCLALARVGGLAAGSLLAVRQREALQATPRRLAGRRLVVAVLGDYAAAAAPIRSGLAVLEAEVLPVLAADAVAATANAADVDLALVVQPFDEPGARVAYYGTAGYRSLRGYALAERLEAALRRCYGSGSGPVAATFGVLRETRMAAVVCQPTPAEVGDDLACLATAIVDGVRAGFEDPPAC